MSAAGLLAPAPAPAGAPPAPEFYPEEDEELESAEDDERSCRGRESDEGASCGRRGRGRRGSEGAARSAVRGRGKLAGPPGGARLQEVTPTGSGAGAAGGRGGRRALTVTGRRAWGSCCQSRRSLEGSFPLPQPSPANPRALLVGMRKLSSECLEDPSAPPFRKVRRGSG